MIGDKISHVCLPANTLPTHTDGRMSHGQTAKTANVLALENSANVQMPTTKPSAYPVNTLQQHRVSTEKLPTAIQSHSRHQEVPRTNDD